MTGHPLPMIAIGMDTAAKSIPHCSRSIVCDENLLLRGLGMIYKKNKR